MMLPVKLITGCKRALLIAPIGFGLLGWLPTSLGQTIPIAGTSPGYSEAGLPLFAILGPEAMGLSSAPVDFHQMPDGRLLVFGIGEFALGDGVRWEVFRQAEGDPQINTASVAIDPSGHIYAGIKGGFGRIEFDPNGKWRYVKAGDLPPDLSNAPDALTTVSMVNTNWYWTWRSGPVVEWQPGKAAKTVGRINALERVFTLGSTVYMSDLSTGELFRLENRRLGPVDWKLKKFVRHAITSNVTLRDGSTLLGTISIGLLRYDGKTLTPFVSNGPLSGSHRINDLCDVGNGLVAVALDNVGVVFIDQKGNIIQSLDRAADNRLLRVKRLLHTPGGTLWALLNEGIVRVGFPSRISSLESMVSTGLSFCRIYRHNEKLWLMADGQAQRGIYDEAHRLRGFEVNTPSPYLTILADLGGDWLATSQEGIFRHEPDSTWKLVVEGPVSAAVRPEPVQPDCWLFSAENEVGWLRRKDGQFIAERFPQPGMGHTYGAIPDKHGVFWAELGTGRVARIEATMPRPTVQIFGPAEGISDAWAQIFLFEGEIRVNTNDQITRYDPELHRFSRDTALLQRVPALAGALGRPAVDAQGRLWFTKKEGVFVVNLKAPAPQVPAEVVSQGMRPLYFTTQTDGVVWMNEPSRLARLDPALPAPELPPLQARITRADLPSSNQVFFPMGGRIPNLQPTTSTLLVHYIAPHQATGQPINFEVQLSGSDGGWVSTGSNGSITLNHLNHGDYQLRVRPRMGQRLGAEAHLNFSILAPWYQTRPAYLVFGTTAICCTWGIIWLVLFFQKREKTRLERLVAQRTAELERQIQETNEKAAALRASEERFRRLNDNAPDIIFRVRVSPDVGYDYISPAVLSITGYHPEEFLDDPTLPRKITQPPGTKTIYDNALDKRISDTVREVHWLSRDGRTVILEERLSAVTDAAGKLIAIEGISRDITQRVQEQERRQKLESQLLQSQKLESVGTLAGGIAHDFNNILTGILGFCELASLSKPDSAESAEYLQQIRAAGLRAKDLVTRILTFSRRTKSKLAAVNLAGVVREAMKLVRASTPSTIAIQTEFEDGVVQADATQIHQIIVNLCNNSIQAMDGNQGTLRVSVRRIGSDANLAKEIPNLPAGPCMRLSVDDNGHGMDRATLSRIFDPFFTTKEQGKGTGLGLSIVQGIVANHGAALQVHSQPGKGTILDMYFPESSYVPELVPALSAPLPGRQRSILVVDDEPSIASFIAKSLTKFDYRVSSFTDPQEAAEVYMQAPAQFDAIVTDLTMPNMTGAELIKNVRSTGVIIPVILASGYNQTLTTLAPEVAYLTHRISKPFDGVDLARLLGQVLKDR